MVDISITLMLVTFALALGAMRATGARGTPSERTLLMVWHTGWCLVYWQYAQTAVADASLYLKYGATAELSLVPGTPFVNSLAVVLVRYLGLNELNCYLAFNLPGALGLLLLHAAIWEAASTARSRAAKLARLLVWLPGLSFWSAAPGKDGLAFFGAAAVVYASLDWRTRWRWLVFGTGVMFLMRPHMAALLVVSGVLAQVLDRRLGSRRLVVLWSLVVVAGLLIPFALEYVGLQDVQRVEDVTSYVEQRQSLNMGGSTSVDVSSMNPLERLFTYMFRPLFFDAPGLTGLVVSVENLILLLSLAAALLAALRAPAALHGFGVRFNIIYGAAGWILLAEVTSNLGIAIRQKTMLLPSLLLLGVMALAAPGRSRGRRLPAGPPPRLEHQDRPQLVLPVSTP